MEHMYSQQLLDQFRSGRKEFTNIHLHFCTLDNVDLSGLVVKDSKIEYTAFWHSNLKDAKFINCEMFFVSFYTAILEDTVFDKCKIEMTRFDSAILKNTRILNSSISYCLAISANLGELNLQGTSQFKFITDPNGITDEEIAGVLRIIGNRSKELPIEIKSEIQKRISGSLKDFGRDPAPNRLSQDNKTYPADSKSYNKASNAYEAMGNFADGIIKYGSSEVYKAKKKDIYKQ